jgi:hypothetical protein
MLRKSLVVLSVVLSLVFGNVLQSQAKEDIAVTAVKAGSLNRDKSINMETVFRTYPYFTNVKWEGTNNGSQGAVLIKATVNIPLIRQKASTEPNRTKEVMRLLNDITGMELFFAILVESDGDFAIRGLIIHTNTLSKGKIESTIKLGSEIYNDVINALYTRNYVQIGGLACAINKMEEK